MAVDPGDLGYWRAPARDEWAPARKTDTRLFSPWNRAVAYAVDQIAKALVDQ
jgi:hypothetical protein